jgi:hypothetical protein
MRVRVDLNKLSPNFSICEFLAVPQRGESGYGPELPYEVGNVIESASIANFCYGMIFIHQQPAGLPDSDLI